MFPVEIFFRKLYDYFRVFSSDKTIITAPIRLKSMDIYISCRDGNLKNFKRRVKSLAFEVLKMYTDCFVIKHEDLDVVYDGEEDIIWERFDYEDYESLKTGIYGIYCSEFNLCKPKNDFIQQNYMESR